MIYRLVCLCTGYHCDSFCCVIIIISNKFLTWLTVNFPQRIDKLNDSIDARSYAIFNENAFFVYFQRQKAVPVKRFIITARPNLTSEGEHRSSYAGLCPWSLLWSQFLTLPVSLTNKSLAFISAVKPMFPPVMSLAPHARRSLRSERPLFADFAKSFKNGRLKSTKREISRQISLNNGESSERVSVVFFPRWRLP